MSLFRLTTPLVRGIQTLSLFALLFSAPMTAVPAEYHHVSGCPVCHDYDNPGGSSNLFLINQVIQTPNSGPRPVVFTAFSGQNSLADGDAVYDGPCEVCHTQNDHHNNDGHDNTAHFDGEWCVTCHQHGNQFAAPFKQLHQTHLYDPKGSVIENIENKTKEEICLTCHETFPVGRNFADGLPIETTRVCDTCHSPGGLVNGSAMAKANTLDGIYESDGLSLKPGNEKWCISCHDADNAVIKGISAPNVAGQDLDSDGTNDYGYYVTGHKINCLECHDPLKQHIDGKQRTYDSSLGNHQEGYRLRSKNGRALIMPRAGLGTNLNDAALCTSCHNANEVLGAGATYPERITDMSHTNYVSRGSGNSPYGKIYGLHTLHFFLDMRSPETDSDYDGLLDSNINCTTCHNVHGARNSRMIRSGELTNPPSASSPDPGFDFIYYRKSPDTFTATYPAPQGTYNVYSWVGEYFNRADKVPYIINAASGPQTVYLNQKTNQYLSLSKPELLVNDGRWNSLGTYTFDQNGSVVISSQDTSGAVIADALFFEDTSGQNHHLIEHSSASFDTAQAWKTFTDPQPGSGSSVYNGTVRFIYEVQPDPYAPVQETIGVQFQTGIGAANPRYCRGCHGKPMNYGRTAKTYPMVLGGKAVPNRVTPSNRQVELVTRVLHHGNSVQSVTVDLSPLGINDSAAVMTYSGREQLAKLDDGSTVQGRDLYSLSVTVPDTIADNLYALEITATDSAGVSSKNRIQLYAEQDGEIVIDDSEAEFIGRWLLFVTAADQFGSGIHFKDIYDGSAKVIYRPSIPATGDYYLYAWWSQGSASWRATNVPYVVNHVGGSETFLIDQTINGPGGGQWHCLGGPYKFNQGTDGYIEINDNANHKFVVADAIKLVPAASVASCK